MKQVTLLVVTNFAVLMMLSGLLAVLRILGVIPPDLGLSSYTGMLVLSALMGFERMRAVYVHAIAERYRFFSYGDASLLLPGEA